VDGKLDRHQVVAVAQALARRGQRRAALDEYFKLVEEDPLDSRIWLKIGELFVSVCRPAAAVDVFGRLGDFYASQGFHAKAIAIFERALRVDAGALEVVSHLADLYALLGLRHDALRHLTRLAAAHARVERRREEAAVLRRVLELDPAHVAARARLLELSARLGPAGVEDDAPSTAGLLPAARVESQEHGCAELADLARHERSSSPPASFRIARVRCAPPGAAAIRLTTERRFLAALVEEQLVSPEQQALALAHATEAGTSLLSLLVHGGIVAEEALLAVVARTAGVPSIDLDDLPLDEMVVSLIPRQLALATSALPIHCAGPTLILAMSNPLDHAALRDVAFCTGRPVEPVAASARAIEAAIQRAYAPTN